MTLAISVGVLMAGCAFLILQRGMIRIILGFVLLSHAAHLTIMASGGTSRREPPLTADSDPAVTADALPQAFVLTAIVIAFAITIYLLVLAVVGGDDDDTEDHDLDDVDVLTELSRSDEPSSDTRHPHIIDHMDEDPRGGTA